MKILLVILASMAGLTVLVEIVLRLTMGLGNPALYIADPDIGYLLAPKQKLRRSGNLIEINQYSMRHQDITLEKAANTKRIFLLGDSVVYGTWRIDQTQILSALVAKQLKKVSGNDSIEVFNASANSWAPRNELAYLKRFGSFDADVLVLVINTDDLFAQQPSSLVVGKSLNYPDKAPPLALIELYQFYFAKPQLIPELEKLKEAEKDRPGANLAAIKEIKAIADLSNARFILALTPLLREFKRESTQEEIAARKRLEKLVNQENIEYIDFLNVWQDFPQPEFLYRDHIHPSPQGNFQITETLTQSLIKSKAISH